MKNFVVIFITLIFSAFVCPNIAVAATASISGLVFTTVPVSVAPGELSSAITVQTQNSSGGAEQVDETNDVTFSSTSASGQFLNSSGNAVSTTMSKNTASRTFYYKDDTLGTHTLSVSITGRTSGATFSASQEIVVGASSGGSSSTSTTATSTSGSTSSSSTSISSGSVSAHSEQEDVSSVSPVISLKAGAGRERIVTAHTPLELHGITSSLPENSGELYSWSFGDGSTGSGEYITHGYEFAGDYNVVLSVSAGASRAVARTKVKVVEPDLKITNVVVGDRGFVEIKNNSQYEVNIEGWQVLAEGGKFIFPKNTIMSARSSLKFPYSFPFSTAKVFLTYPNQYEVAHYDLPTIQSASVDSDSMEKRVAEANIRLAEWRKEWEVTHSPSSLATVSTSTAPNADKKLIETIKTEQKSGALSTALEAPARIFNFFKGIFTH